MKKVIISILSFLITINSMAQVVDSSKAMADTVVIETVQVSANLPLDNNQIIDFYRTNHFATLDNINARLDGMILIKRGAYAQEPQLNGFSGGQLNITIDGMKMFGACTDKMDPITSYLEPTNLKKITINQGTNGNADGCTIGGSVNMSLQEPSMNCTHSLSSSIGVGYESISNGKNILFATNTVKKKWALGIDGVYRKNENYRTGENKVVPFSQFQKTNVHAVLKYLPDSIRSFKIDVLLDDARNVGYPALPMDVGKATAYLIALEYSRISKFPFKAKMYFNSIYHVMDDSKRDSLYLLKNKTIGKSDSVYMRMDMPGRSSTLGAYIQKIIQLNTMNKLMIKADNYTNYSIAEMTMHMRYAGFSPEPIMYMQTWPAMLRNVSGLFIQNTTSVSKKLQLVCNGRIDYNIDILQSAYAQQQFSVFNYSLPNSQSMLIKSINVSSQYLLLKNLSMVVSVGYSERMPTIGERLGFYLYNAYDGYDYIGNPYLKTEKSNYFRIQLLLSKPKFKVNLSQSLSLVNDYIMGVTDSTIPSMNFYTKGTRVYSNIPNANLYSTDFQLLYMPTKSLTLFINSKYTHGVIGANEPMPLIAPLSNVIAMQYQKSNVLVQLECENTSSQNRINSNYGEHRTAAYSIFNFKSGYSFPLFKKTVDVSIGVSNILNKVYYAHLDWGRIYRPGRSIDLFIKYLM